MSPSTQPITSICSSGQIRQYVSTAQRAVHLPPGEPYLQATPWDQRFADGSVYIVDNWGHAIYRFLPSGELDLMLTRQSKDCSYDQLVDPDRPESVTRVSPPFNYPTHAIEARGSIYVADGYGNARVHVFTRAGEYTRGWGEPGDQSGAFRLPHGLALGVDGELYVADRLNARVQLFDLDGGLIGAWPARHPNAVAVDANGPFYVAELGSVFLFSNDADLAAPRARVTVRNPRGDIIDQVCSERSDLSFAPHSLAVDSGGNLYVGEVAASYSRGLARREEDDHEAPPPPMNVS